MPGERLIDTENVAAARAAVTSPAATIDLLHQEIANPDTQWSIGTFGGIAEFSRDPDEPASVLRSTNGVSAVTARGGIAIRHHDNIRPFASESITKTGWSQRVALCLPADDCAMSRRAVLTELDSDHEALRPQDRGSTLFDLGLGALHIDFCVRIGDPGTIAQLRSHVGCSVFEPGNPAMGLILAANPHRVVLSRIGRVEVHQPIPPPSGKSPEGPHTHVLPKLLKSGRTHAATEPIPEGWIPCAHLYPPHPTHDGLGKPRPFDAAHHHSFQQMMEIMGDPASIATKWRVADAIRAEEPPWAFAHDRQGRSSIRIALRQLKASGHVSPVLQTWLAQYDPAGAEAGSEDDAVLQHNC